MKLALRFLDVEATIWSDDEAFINLFRQMYARFIVPKLSSVGLKSSAEFAYLTRSDNPWGKPLLLLDGEICPLVPRSYAYINILKSIFRRIRSHLLIHAGAVAWGDQAALLVADTMHGKTTLVLELVRRGFKFFSDDVAALSRADGMIHPFPRALAIRAGTFKMFGMDGNLVGIPNDDPPTWFGKRVLDIETVQPASLAKASPLRHIIILQSLKSASRQRVLSSEYDLLLSHCNEAFLQAIHQIDGLKEMRQGQANGYPPSTSGCRACRGSSHRLLRLSVSSPSVISQVESLCQSHRILVLNLMPNNAPPSFSGPAQLEKIVQSQAILALMAHFQGGLHSTLLQKEFGGRSIRLFMELARLVGGAKCYQLSLGPLQDMADLVREVTSNQ